MPKAGSLELAVEEGMRHRLVPVDELQRRARKERAEDRFEAELRRKDDEEREQQKRTADADLGGRILQAEQGLREAHRALQAENGGADRKRKDEEDDQQHELAAKAPRMAGEEQREQHDRRHLRDRRACDDNLAEGCRGLARILEDRQDHAEAGRRQHDRDQERRGHEPARLEAVTHGEGESERDREAGCGQAQQAPPQAGEVDLDAGEEEQESETDDAQHLDRLVVRRPVEPLRPDRDPEEDLDHDRRQAQPRNVDTERGNDRDRCDERN